MNREFAKKIILELFKEAYLDYCRLHEIPGKDRYEAEKTYKALRNTLVNEFGCKDDFIQLWMVQIWKAYLLRGKTDEKTTQEAGEDTPS